MLSNISIPWGRDVRSSNLTPYCHISLPYITNFVINANHQRSQPTPSHCAMCQYVECHLLILCLSSSYATCRMLVHAYAISSGKAKWSGPHHTIKMLHLVLFHSVTCYTNSMVSNIHVDTTKLCNITCTLLATGVILRSLECIEHWNMGFWLWRLDPSKCNVC